MVFLLSLVFLLTLDCLDSSGSFHPTNEEIQRGLPSHVYESWGQQARKENSLRILCLGGSNTAGHENISYVSHMNKFLRENEVFSKTSFVIQRGISGGSPEGFIARKYDFEEWIDWSTWPNVILLEFSVNVGKYPPFQSARELELLVRAIFRKYKNVGINSRPEVMIFELLAPYELSLHAHKYQNRYERINQLQNLSESQVVSKHGNGFGRGCKHNVYITEFAKFYNFPVISYCDAVWPSFIRHYVERGHVETWPLTVEGIHLSELGCELAVEKMIGPFLLSIMAPRVDHTNPSKNSMYGFDLRMFASSLVRVDVLSYSTWGVVNNTLAPTIVNPSANWTFRQTHHHTVGHWCYPTNVHMAKATFRIEVPEVCSALNLCGVSLTSLFTWNDSYIGFMTCDLYRLFNVDELRDAVTVRRKLNLRLGYMNHKLNAPHKYHSNAAGFNEHFSHINSTGNNTRHFVSSTSISGYRPRGGTFPLPTVLTLNATQGIYEIDCTNVEMLNEKQSKEACIIGISVHGQLML